MTKRTAIACLAVFAVSALSGCGTVRNMCPETIVTPLDNHPMTIYGGVRLDAEDGVGCVAESVTTTDLGPFRRIGLASLGTFVLCVDLPLSVVGDTVTLPRVITYRASGGHIGGPILDGENKRPAPDQSPASGVMPTAASGPASP